jgi:hypothetical protein
VAGHRLRLLHTRLARLDRTRSPTLRASELGARLAQTVPVPRSLKSSRETAASSGHPPPSGTFTPLARSLGLSPACSHTARSPHSSPSSPHPLWSHLPPPPTYHPKRRLVLPVPRTSRRRRHALSADTILDLSPDGPRDTPHFTRCTVGHPPHTGRLAPRARWSARSRSAPVGLVPLSLPPDTARTPHDLGPAITALRRHARHVRWSESVRRTRPSPTTRHQRRTAQRHRPTLSASALAPMYRPRGSASSPRHPAPGTGDSVITSRDPPCAPHGPTRYAPQFTASARDDDLALVFRQRSRIAPRSTRHPAGSISATHRRTHFPTTHRAARALARELSTLPPTRRAASPRHARSARTASPSARARSPLGSDPVRGYPVTTRIAHEAASASAEPSLCLVAARAATSSRHQTSPTHRAHASTVSRHATP